MIAPCTGPVLAGILAWVATTRNIWIGASLLFTYALGIGVLFWVIATFAASLQGRLPRTGPWMDGVKSILGVGLFVAALYYLQNVSPGLARFSSGKPMFLWLTLGLIAAGLLLGAVHVTLHSGKLSAYTRKLVGAALLSFGLFGQINYAFAPARELPWLYDEKRAIGAAKKADRPLLVDFSAQWCLPCKEMEAHIFTDPAVRRRLESFILLKLDVTEDNAKDRALQDKYGAHELPQVILFGRRGTEVARFGKISDPNQMLEQLKKAQ